MGTVQGDRSRLEVRHEAEGKTEQGDRNFGRRGQKRDRYVNSL